MAAPTPGSRWLIRYDFLKFFMDTLDVLKYRVLYDERIDDATGEGVHTPEVAQDPGAAWRNSETHRLFDAHLH